MELGGTISGYVYEADGRTPIADLRVTFKDYQTGQWINQTDTKQDGGYTLTLHTGSYKVTACPSCSGTGPTRFADQAYGRTSPSRNATAIAVTAPNGTPDIDFTLELVGTISGHVYRADGLTPIADMRVRARDTAGEQIGSADTAKDGSYTLMVATGSYRVETCPSCSDMAEFLPEYHDGGNRLVDATPVAVIAPDDTAGIDFTLEMGGTISGHVFRADGRIPIAGMNVFAQNENGNTQDRTDTAQDGSYTLRLPTGSYRVQACPPCSDTDGFIREWYDETIRTNDASFVAVTAPDDTPNVDFTLELGGAVSGYVYEADGRTPIVHAKVHAKGVDWTIYVYTQQDGSYSISVPSGVYDLYVVPSYAKLPRYVEQRWYDGGFKQGRREDATPVTVAKPGNTAGKDFTLEALGTISGHVYQADGETPFGDVDVFAEEERSGIGIAGARTKQDGSYSMVVPSGTYNVGVCPICSGLRGYAEQYFGIEFDPSRVLSSYTEKFYGIQFDREKASPVSVTGPDDSPNIDLTLKPGEGAGTNVSPDHPGRWIPVSEVPVAGWFAALLPTGKVLLFKDGSSMALFDPQTRRFNATFFANTNLFCAGLTLLADGRLLAVGGDRGKDPHDHFLGLKSAEIFDPWQEKWTRISDMVGGERWYPTAITLFDGRVLVASGEHAGENNETLEILDQEQLEWKLVGNQSLPNYPWAAVMPQGDVLFYGPQREAMLFDPELGAFRNQGSRALGRSGGTGVILDAVDGRFLALGGGNPTTGSADILDISDSRWRPAGSMSYARHYADAVLLPDGKVLVVGGHPGHSGEDEEGEGGGEPWPAELYDPELESWQETATAHYGHGYHGTSLLLPDGSVIAAGPSENLEIYFPWYFFRERPVLEGIPDDITYDQTFLVQTPDPLEIVKVLAIRLSSVTHSVNNDQRSVELRFRRSVDGLLADSPSQPALAPPGYYMLFILTAQNVPSQGRIIQIK